MRRLIMSLTLAAVAVPAVPADAQVYPERINSVVRTVVRPRVERYQRRDDRASEVERITRTMRLGSTGEIEASNISGDIVVTRGGGNDVVIEIVKTGRGRTAEEARAMLPLVEVDVSERAGRVEIRSRYPQRDDMRRRNWRNINVDVAFNITAPERARVIVNTVSGDISVRDIKGDVSLETISGDVRIANAGRVSKAKTASGDVEIVDTTFDGLIDAATISGTLLLRNVKARQLDLGSISGDVVLEDVTCDRVEAQSISGDVRLAGPLVRGGRYDLGSHSGEIRVSVAPGVGFEIDASSFSGSVRADVELKLVTTGSGRRGQRAIRGTYGDGGAVLDLQTFSGSIVVTRR
jgi:DUF4097 and DUF4098 domain-containing protein YvlB